jgi:glycosyltransferase involved in cell wall biosynthesis
MKKSLSIIIPVYNEERTIQKAVKEVDTFSKTEKLDYEIIIVDSASTDNTEKASREILKKYKKLKYIRQKVRKGFGNGLKEGYDNATKDYIIFVDADLPYNLNNIKKSYPYMGEYDVILGYKSGKRENFMRWIMSYCYNLFMRIMFNVKYKDFNYSYKILKRSAIKKMQLESDGWFISPEIVLKAHHTKLKIKEIHVPFTPRSSGESKVSYYKTTKYFLKEIFRFRKKFRGK